MGDGRHRREGRSERVAAASPSNAREHHRGDRPSGRVGCAILTVSDSRGVASDRSGAVIRDALVGAGHPILASEIVRDDRAAIRATVGALAARADVAAVIVSGGTGIAAHDVTVESLAGLWTKEMPGFGELFRALSFEQVGAASFLSRATAGVVAGTFVALLPGSPRGCALAMERLILPELGHIAGLLAASP